jgi:hypothetical protein
MKLFHYYYIIYYIIKLLSNTLKGRESTVAFPAVYTFSIINILYYYNYYIIIIIIILYYIIL